MLGNISDVTKLAGFEFTKYVTYEDEGNIIAIRGLNCKNGSLDLRDVKYIDNSDFSKLTRSKLYIGDILYTYVGTVGEVAVVDKNDKYYLAPNVARIRLSEDYNSDFIKQLLGSQNFYNRIVFPLIATSSQPALSMENLRKFNLKTPSIKEQQKISILLSLLDERIATQNKIIDKLQSLIKGINKHVFTSNGVNYKLEGLCEIRSGYSGNQLTSKRGLKVSRIETISGHKVNMERVGYVAPFESSENYRLQVGDILFSNINSVEYIGNTAFIDKDYNLYHGMNLLRLIPNDKVVIPFYLYLLFNTNRVLNRFKTICNKAVSQASINQTELGKIVIQIPDKNAQKQICELYQALYAKLESEKYANSLFQNQKQYLLRQMFI